jgi:CubicO group peptidase (beta-lactamase class C family)
MPGRKKVLRFAAALAALSLPGYVSGQDPPLRASQPVETIASDLEGFVPRYMHDQKIPGVSVALVSDFRVAWKKGFGVSNAITRDPVMEDTVFEVASNSKVVTAYVALRLVDMGRLSLDKSMNSYLAQPWLPASPYRDLITLRHVLSHSAGLAHNTLSRESLFAPGVGYSYSAIGYMYLQAVIEEVTGQPLETVARQTTFEPLGMSSSSFINRPDLTPRTSNGHVHALVPALAIAVPFVLCAALFAIVGLPIHRIRTGRWRPGRGRVQAVLALAFVLTTATISVLLWRVDLQEFAALIVLLGFLIAGVVLLALWATEGVLHRLSTVAAGRKSVIVSLSALVTVTGILLLASKISNFPVPKWPPVHAQAAGSMRATAADLAVFLIELSGPRHLSAETARQMSSPQVRLSDELSWGLGPGIQHSKEGDALWQWGQHLHFQSLMIIYPERGFGAVVCTNNDLLNPDVAVEIAHRALGGKMEPIRRAVHLQYNYRGSGEHAE